jgi:hypothetical protein
VSLAIRETGSRASLGLARAPNSQDTGQIAQGNRKDIGMRRLSTPCSFLVATFALAFLPATVGAQSENPIAIKATNQPVDVLRAGPEASETQCCKSLISTVRPILQPGTLREPGQAPIKPWAIPSIPSDAPTAKLKSWIGAGPGSLPLPVAVQPDVTPKYGTNPGVVQVYFGHRP